MLIHYYYVHKIIKLISHYIFFLSWELEILVLDIWYFCLSIVKSNEIII